MRATASGFVPVVLVACLGLVVSACGQKGPLYLPKKTKTTVTAPDSPPAPAATPAPAPAPGTTPGTSQAPSTTLPPGAVPR